MTDTPWYPPVPPDPPTPPPPEFSRPVPRPGQLTVAWQVMVGTAWAAAFFAFAGVWKASEEIGIATWWLGPRADPQPLIVRILPFVIAIVVAIWAVYNTRGVPWISLAGTGAVAVIAAFDVSRSGGLASAEFAIAGGLLLVSLASFGGRYRRRDGTANGSTADEAAASASDDGEPGPTPEPSPPTWSETTG